VSPPPLNDTWRDWDFRARADYLANKDREGKSRRLHNNENDATQCLKVVPTGTRQEWGTNGKFKLVNTCGFPVVASWCANKGECEGNHGSMWSISAGKDYPIFFADPANPFIQVGACRTAKDSKPIPSEAAMRRAGGFNERHNEPVPAAGVEIMRGHTCP